MCLPCMYPSNTSMAPFSFHKHKTIIYSYKWVFIFFFSLKKIEFFSTSTGCVQVCICLRKMPLGNWGNYEAQEVMRIHYFAIWNVMSIKRFTLSREPKQMRIKICKFFYKVCYAHSIRLCIWCKDYLVILVYKPIYVCTCLTPCSYLLLYNCQSVTKENGKSLKLKNIWYIKRQRSSKTDK